MKDILGAELQLGDEVFYYEDSILKLKKIQLKGNYSNTIKHKQVQIKSLEIEVQYLPVYGPYSKDQITYWVYNNYMFKHISISCMCNILNISENYLRAIRKRYKLQKSTGSMEVLILWLLTNYKTSKLKNKEIQKKFQVSKSQLRNLISRYDLTKHREETYLTAKKWLLSNYVNSTKTLKELSKELNVSSKTLGYYVSELKLKKEKTKYELLEDWLIQYYADTNLSNIQIAKNFDVSPSVVFGVTHRLSLIREYIPNKNYALESWLLENYVNSELSTTEISNIFGVHYATVSYHVKKLSLKRPYSPELKTWLLNNYENSELTYQEIAEKFNVSKGIVQYYKNKLKLNRLTHYDQAKSWLNTNFATSLLSQSEICEKFKISPRTLRLYLKDLKLELYSNKLSIWVQKNYATTLLSQREIAELKGVHPSVISYYVNKFNLKKETDSVIISTWLKQNYYKSSKSLLDIANLLNINLKLLKKYLTDLQFDIVNVINETPLPLFPVDYFELSNIFFNKYYPDLYFYLKHIYHTEISINGISRRYNIDLKYLINMMQLLEVYNYADYNLTSKQLGWIIQKFPKYEGSFTKIFKSNLFTEEDRSEFNRFINNN